MGILSHLFCIDINRGVRNYQATPGAVLLDVRSRESYARKRIPESRNLPPGGALPGQRGFARSVGPPLCLRLWGRDQCPGRLPAEGHGIYPGPRYRRPEKVLRLPRVLRPHRGHPLVLLPLKAVCAPGPWPGAQTGNRILTPDSDAGEASEW